MNQKHPKTRPTYDLMNASPKSIPNTDVLSTAISSTPSKDILPDESFFRSNVTYEDDDSMSAFSPILPASCKKPAPHKYLHNFQQDLYPQALPLRSLTKKSSPLPKEHMRVKKDMKQEEETYWDEDSADHELELALSQMVIPAPTSSQPTTQGLSRTKETTKANSPQPVQKDGSKSTKQWGGYVSRNKRLPSNASVASKLSKEARFQMDVDAQMPVARTLSNKRLVAPQRVHVQQAAGSLQCDASPVKCATKTVNPLVIHKPFSPVKSKNRLSELPKSTPNQTIQGSSSSSSLNSAAGLPSARKTFNRTTSGNGSKLHSAFKPPTVVRPDLAGKAREKQKKSVKGAVVNLAPAPAYQGDDLADIDFDDLGEF